MIAFNEQETSVIGSILCQKLGYDIPHIFKGSDLDGLVEGNEHAIIDYIHQVTPENAKKHGLVDTLKSIEEKLNRKEQELR